MVDVKQLLFQICEDEMVYEEIDLIENGVLDSFAIIELFSELADRGIFLEPTEIDRNLLRTAKGIEQLIQKIT